MSGDVDRSPPPSTTHRAIPDYLQPCIVQQEVSRYTAVDQAVWRFVLLMLQERLARTAHASYVRGLARSAISAEHIPSIEEIDRGLSNIGWGAVCVDGFIPPRAFQAFQALGILPIAAEIRTPEHLPYTPAPDIIHEAAGHAPILADPVYAAYLRAIGGVGGRAFSSPADARVDRAVRALSDLKEHPRDDAALGAAEIELERAIAELGPPSEAARVARLYWWTAEYGLVGSPADYRLYGAGLLSSLGESHFCHGSSVQKRVLSPECTLQGYDITRPQPQLFVARDFEHLHDVLGAVTETLAHRVGGRMAVQAALASRELCTLHLAGGAQVIGLLLAAEAGQSGDFELASFESGTALAHEGHLLGRFAQGLAVPLGRLADGADPRQVLGDVAGHLDANGQLHVAYASGLRITGVPTEGPFPAAGVLLWLRDFRLEYRGRSIAQAAPYPWLCSEGVLTASAGSSSPDVSPVESAMGRAPAERQRVPKPKALSAAGTRLERLYARAREARHGGPGAAAALEQVRVELEASCPHEWLLVWNVLDALIELGVAEGPLVAALERRLSWLEAHYEGRHPVAAGLGYLSARKRHR